MKNCGQTSGVTRRESLQLIVSAPFLKPAFLMALVSVKLTSYTGFRTTYVPIQGRSCKFHQNNAKLHTACITTPWFCSNRVWMVNCPACSQDLKTFVHQETRTMTKKSQDCCEATGLSSQRFMDYC